MAMADRLPVGKAIVAAEPCDGGNAGHPRDMQSPGVAAHVKTAFLDDSRQLEQVEIAGKDTPWLKVQCRDQGGHLVFFPLIAGAGEDHLFVRKSAMKFAENFRQLSRRKLFVVLGGEWTDVDPSALTSSSFESTALYVRRNFYVDFGLFTGEAGFF